MTFHPVLPPLLLAVLAATVVAARLVARRTASPRRWSVVTGATLLLLVAAARPVLGEAKDVARVADPTAPNVFLLVDRSPDMAVADATGARSRMAAARDDITAVIDKYPGARFAVLDFAAGPDLEWPLSQDSWSLRPVMAAVTPYPSHPDAAIAANAGAAANLLRYQLIGATQQYPLAPDLVFYFGAGTNGPGIPQGQFNLPTDSVDGGAVFGYGVDADQRALRVVSEQIGVPFVQRDVGGSVREALPTVKSKDDAMTAPPSTRTELYWVFAAGSAALWLVELFLVMRAFRRTQLPPVRVDP
jgi:hypothetical protein